MIEDHEDTLIIGLTGPTGAGKSTAGKLFSDRGAVVLDADEIARDTIDGSPECLADLVLEYSTEIITAEGTLNRKKLAKLCFSDKEKLERLNEITYPHIVQNVEEKIEAACGTAPFVVLDAPTLYEAGLHERCDTVVAVLAGEETRCQRIMARDGMTEEDARLRISAQKKDDFYLARAGHILRNDGDADALRLSFIELWGLLEQALREKSEPPEPAPQAALPAGDSVPENPEKQEEAGQETEMPAEDNNGNKTEEVPLA